ncbi:DUF4411 family protein [Hyphomicrobium sp. DY-1]|uniref:DUF4411 family protein n=1 Tax=Hyphomicrobium sp. DY-1 TaxID=3075650 RepID=UPI0039C418A2
MAYCLDANTFIQAKNLHYAFDFCPAYWDWIDREAASGNLLCVRAIYDELADGKDDLAVWIKGRNGPPWLMKIDAEPVQRAYQTVVRHVEGQRGRLFDEAIATFMAKADPWLIAFALAHGHTVVTYETSNRDARRVVKIPDICADLGVPCIGPYQLLRDLKAKFILK